MKTKSTVGNEKEKISQIEGKLGTGMAYLYRKSLAVELYAEGQGIQKDEIAEMLGCTRDTVNKYLRTAKEDDRKGKRKGEDTRSKLQKRLLMFANLYAEGESEKEIAEELVLDEETVKAYRDFLLRQEKLGPILEKRHRQGVEEREKIERELEEEDEER